MVPELTIVPPPTVMPSLNATPDATGLKALTERMTPLLLIDTSPSTSMPSPSPVTPLPTRIPALMTVTN